MVFIALCSFPCCLYAAEPNEIESITVLADGRLAVPLSQLSSAFAYKSMISAAEVFNLSAQAQKKKIEDGEPADLFITDNRLLIEQLRIKGLVDVYSIGEIAAAGSTHYIAAVVAGENMTAARSFLDFLKSDEGRSVFTKDGFSVP
jgi:ABC-type molybdate transport system substrate-binding protein